MKTYDQMMEEINSIWEAQQQSAKTADFLLDECEKYEEEMLDRLRTIRSLYPKEYQEYLDNFKEQKQRIELSEEINNGNIH